MDALAMAGVEFAEGSFAFGAAACLRAERGTTAQQQEQFFVGAGRIIRHGHFSALGMNVTRRVVFSKITWFRIYKAITQERKFCCIALGRKWIKPLCDGRQGGFSIFCVMCFTCPISNYLPSFYHQCHQFVKQTVQFLFIC